MQIETVAVIGAGPLGRRLAVLFSGAGFATVLEDILPSNLRRAAEYLGHADARGAGTGHGLDRVRFASSVEDAVRTAGLIVDAVPDELESKLEIFSLLDRMAPPQAIVVTPTRHLSIADLASCTYRPDRCIAVRFASDELLPGEPLVLVSTSVTSPAVLDEVVRFWTRMQFRVGTEIDPAEASVAAGTRF